jgi:hypothetical protein
MLDGVLIALLIVALVPYLLGPIAVRFSQRFPARPLFVPYDPIQHPLPDELAATFKESVDALVRTGMRLLGDFAHANKMTKVQLRVAFLGDPLGQEHALVVAAQSTNPKVKMTACFVEFPTRFADGGALSVSNSGEPDIYPQAPGRVLERFPQVRDPARLRRVNASLLARFYGSRSRISLEPADDLAAVIQEASTREYHLQTTTGYMWLDERAQAYRPTMFGAWVMSQRLLPPLRQILERRRKRRGEKLLEQLDMTFPDERPIPAPKRRDQLVWNMLFLIAAALLYLLVRNAGGPVASSVAPFVMPAEFSVPPDFAGAVRALERLSGDSAQPLVGMDQSGNERPTAGVSVRVHGGDELVTAAQDSFLARGFYLFLALKNYGTGPDEVGLFPRRDRYEIIRLIGTNGWNVDVGPDSIVAWLQALEKVQPFVLTGIGDDWIEGRFIGEVGDIPALARRFYAMCPDIVDQGTGTIRELERELRASRTLYCWWD